VFMKKKISASITGTETTSLNIWVRLIYCWRTVSPGYRATETLWRWEERDVHGEMGDYVHDARYFRARPDSLQYIASSSWIL
jgi:hypothetical protein